MESNQFLPALEAVLFAAGEPVELSRLAQALDIREAAARELLFELRDRCAAPESGLQLLELDGRFQLATKPAYAAPVKTALELRRNTPLSNAAMEALAIIAYNEPVTRGFVEQVRGVDSSQTVANLVEKGLVEEAGRLDVPGRPIAYRTSAGFLRTFGLKSLDDLPPIPDDSGQVMLDEVVGRAEAAQAGAAPEPKAE